MGGRVVTYILTIYYKCGEMVILPQINRCSFFRRYDRRLEACSETYRSFVHLPGRGESGQERAAGDFPPPQRPPIRGIGYRIRGLFARYAGRDTAPLRWRSVRLMRPNESSLGRDTVAPKLRKKFFFCIEELSGLLTSYGTVSRAFAGLCSVETPLAAPFRMRLLRGKCLSFPGIA
jgi:hypothetical protein